MSESVDVLSLCTAASKSNITAQKKTGFDWPLSNKPHKPLFLPHAGILPPKQCLSLSCLTVVYSRQGFDSLISCCLNQWIRLQSDTLNLHFVLGLLFLSLLCALRDHRIRHAFSPLREAARAHNQQILELEPAWLLCM